MTAPDPADTVIGQAARIMHDAYEAAAVQEGWETQQRSRVVWEDVPEANKRTMYAALRALHDAGLLADPADRDERRNEAYRAQLARADHAEAERDEWLTKFREAQAEIGQVRQVCREVDGQRERAEAKLAQTEVALGDAMAAEVAELRAMVKRVRELADRLDSPYSNPSVRYMSTRIREALNGAGESDGE